MFRPDLWAHIRLPHVQCVCVCAHVLCVCVYTHTHRDTHTLTPIKNREITDITPIHSIHLSKITTHAEICALYGLAEPFHWVPPSSSNNHEHTVHTRAHVRTLLRLFWQIWTMVSTDTCYSVHTCACTGAQETYLAQATPTIMHTHPRMHAYADGTTSSLPWTILNTANKKHWVATWCRFIVKPNFQSRTCSHARLSRDDLMPSGQCLISGYQVTSPYNLDTWNRLGWSLVLARPQPCALVNSTSGRPNLIEWYSPRQGTVDDLMSKCSANVFFNNLGKSSARFGSIPQLFLETGLAPRKWGRFIRIVESDLQS